MYEFLNGFVRMRHRERICMPATQETCPSSLLIRLVGLPRNPMVAGCVLPVLLFQPLFPP